MRKPRLKANPSITDCLADLWARACEYDEIDPAAACVVFSPTNRFAVAYNRAVAGLRDLARRPRT